MPTWGRNRLPKDALPLVSNDFDKDPFAAAAVEFAVEDLFPPAEIKFPRRNGHYYLAPHDLPLNVGIPIIFPGEVVPILRDRFVGGKAFEKVIVILY